MMLVILFFIVALLYSMVGFGGGSSYTALLALSDHSPLTIRTIALCCNMIVVSIGFIRHLKHRTIHLRQAFHFLLFSVPMVHFASQWTLSNSQFFLLLGTALTVAGLLLFLSTKQPTNQQTSLNPHPLQYWCTVIILGCSLGALAGLTGIGGGIYLSPILLLLRFDRPKRIAALATAFIFINSLVGLITLFATKPALDIETTQLFLIISVILGGVIGSKLMHLKLNEQVVRKLTGILVLFVGARILYLNF